MRFVSKFKPKSKLEAILSLAVVLAVLIGSWQILDLRGENDRLTSRLQAAHGEILRLETEVSKANDIITEANADIQRLQSDLSQSNAETKRLRGELGEANSLIRQQNAALQEAQESIGGGSGIATLISLGCLFLGLPC